MNWLVGVVVDDGLGRQCILHVHKHKPESSATYLLTDPTRGNPLWSRSNSDCHHKFEGRGVLADRPLPRLCGEASQGLSGAFRDAWACLRIVHIRARHCRMHGQDL